MCLLKMLFKYSSSGGGGGKVLVVSAAYLVSLSLPAQESAPCTCLLEGQQRLFLVSSRRKGVGTCTPQYFTTTISFVVSDVSSVDESASAA